MIRELEAENDNELYQFLNLLKASFPNSRYQFINVRDIKPYVQLIKKMQGFVLVYGSPIVGTCQSRLLKHSLNNSVLDIVQIGGMCIKAMSRGQNIATKLNFAIREKYHNTKFHDFAIFSNRNSAGYYHAISCGFKEIQTWSKTSISICKNNLNFGINYDNMLPIQKQKSAFLFEQDEINKILGSNIFGPNLFTLIRGKEQYLMSKNNNRVNCLGKLNRYKNFIAVSPAHDLENDDSGNIECIIESSKSSINRNMSLLTFKKDLHNWKSISSVPRLATF